MNRRQHLMSMAGLAMAPWAEALLPRHARAASGDPASVTRAAAPTPGAIPAGDGVGAWQRNFAAVPDSFGPTRIAFDRPLPAGLTGTLYRNGPARFHRGATHYDHWFDGDGMIQSFRLAGRELVHQGRLVRTEKVAREEPAGRFLYPGFATPVPSPNRIGSPDDLNPANISVLPVDGQLLALWEAGSPYRIDLGTLATIGRQRWSEETDGLPFSAHPKREPDGTIWSFGYLPGSGKLVLYRLSSRNVVERVGLIEAQDVDMVHDFAVTQRYLVFVTMPFDYARDAAGTTFYQRLTFNGQRTSQVLLIDKSTLQPAHRIELPALAVFHFANAWDDGDDLRIQLMQLDDFKALNDDIFAAMRGEPVVQIGGTRAVELQVSPSRGQVVSTVLHPAFAEFPSIDPRRVGRQSRYLFSAARTDELPHGTFGLNAVARLDTRSGKRHHYSYGATTLAEEPLYLPRPGGAEGDGWVIGTAYDFARSRTVVNVFDAQALDAGPISRAVLPYGLPLGLHGAFVPA